MSGILDPFLESIHNLPCNVRRNLSLITDLDQKVQKLTRQADAMVDQYLARAETLTPEQKQEEMEKVHILYSQAQHLCEEKMQLSQQTYNLVDKQITQIDDEIEKVKEKQANSDAASGEKGGHGSGGGGGGPSGSGGSNKDGKRGRKRTKAFDSAADVIIEGMCLNMEIDPSKWPYEWFHFPCVNLKSKPKGKWYCEHCTKKRSSSK
ncbi:Inhibitor of growth protein 5 [Tyrophagus putrescentiae]|nr:Inhibitor of growth protein 5 [Tyrophagus putrescentiae]